MTLKKDTMKIVSFCLTHLFNGAVKSELCRLKYPSGYSATSFFCQQHSVIVKLFSRLLTVESQKVLNGHIVSFVTI